MEPGNNEKERAVLVRNVRPMKDIRAIPLFLCGFTTVLLGCESPPPPPESNRIAADTTYTVQAAEEERRRLIANYIEDDDYTGFESEADGVNHMAFVTLDLERTIEFYTQVIRLKLLRVRAMDGDPQSTQVFFDMGRGELLAFLRLNDMGDRRQTDACPFHHAALTISREQYKALIDRLDERRITYTTISHEILDTVTLTDPNGILLELSVWNIDPRDVQM
jgi:catechol 2,3-dioxygenase-like lactoylglutathione lyase family enzyme